MPDIEPKDPKLHFANHKGEYLAEYIPPANYKFMNWFRNKYIRTRNYFGKDIYYWHVRHNLYPNYRKTADIEFIMHVIKDHDQEPTDPIERRHYNRAWALYGHEVKYVTGEIGKDKDTEWENEEILHGHPYAYAYTKQWFEKFPEIESKLLYHGVSVNQYVSLLDLLRERALQRRNDYCEKYGLDPESGKKLATAESSKKPRRKAIKHRKSPAKESKNETS